jgi:hypothetical protein
MRPQAFLASFLLLSTPLLAAPYETVRSSGSPANRVDFLVVAEGYTSAQLGTFRTDVNNFLGQLFAQEPYRTYQNYYNVHILLATSSQSGADHPERGVSVSTAFDATYNCFNIQRLICVDDTKVEAAVSSSLPSSAYYDQILVLVNDTEYGGSGGAIAVASKNSAVVELVLHEVGHSFALLTDEYTTNPPSCVLTEPSEPNATMQTSRSSIKWRHWISASTAIPTTGTAAGVPGLYQGADYCSSGKYRPTYNSKMRTLGQPFEPINSEAHVKRIYNFVSPIDSVQPSGSSISIPSGQTVTFQVVTPSPVGHSLSVTWFVDGVAGGSGPSFSSNSVPSGTHTLRADVRDATSMVRNDPQQVLIESRTWTVTQGGSTSPTPTPTPPSAPTPTPTPTTPGGPVEITPGGSAVTASTSDTNVPANTVDNSLSTRWSANGDGAWIRYDLGSMQTVAFVRLAAYSGNSRQNRFDLQLSNDGATWTNVITGGLTSGTTTAEETHDFADQSARFVRYVGHMNTLNTFNSLTEVSIYAAGGGGTTPTPTPTATPTLAPQTPTPTPTATPASGCGSETFTGTLSAPGMEQVQPNGSWYQTTVSGTHVGCLTGPSGGDFDLYLDQWNGSTWSQVAAGETPTAGETATYTGMAGYYRWRIRAYSGTGGYTFLLKRP